MRGDKMKFKKTKKKKKHGVNCCFIVSYIHTGLFKNTKHTSGTGSNKEAFSPGITLGRYGDRSCKEQKKTKTKQTNH